MYAYDIIGMTYLNKWKKSKNVLFLSSFQEKDLKNITFFYQKLRKNTFEIGSYSAYF